MSTTVEADAVEVLYHRKSISGVSDLLPGLLQPVCLDWSGRGVQHHAGAGGRRGGPVGHDTVGGSDSLQAPPLINLSPLRCHSGTRGIRLTPAPYPMPRRVNCARACDCRDGKWKWRALANSSDAISRPRLWLLRYPVPFRQITRKKTYHEGGLIRLLASVFFSAADISGWKPLWN